MEYYYYKKNCSCDKCEKKNHGEKHEKHEKDKKHEKVEDRCSGCVCEQFRRLGIGTAVDLYLSSGAQFAAAVFNNLDEKSCCAYFTFGATPLIVSCKDITAINIV